MSWQRERVSGGLLGRRSICMDRGVAFTGAADRPMLVHQEERASSELTGYCSVLTDSADSQPSEAVRCRCSWHGMSLARTSWSLYRLQERQRVRRGPLSTSEFDCAVMAKHALEHRFVQASRSEKKPLLILMNTPELG